MCETKCALCKHNLEVEMSTFFNNHGVCEYCFHGIPVEEDTNE